MINKNPTWLDVLKELFSLARLEIKVEYTRTRSWYFRIKHRLSFEWRLIRVTFLQHFVWTNMRIFMKLWGFDYIQWYEDVDSDQTPLIGFGFFRSKHFKFHIEGTNILAFKMNAKQVRTRVELTSPIDQVSRFTPDLPSSEKVQ